MKNNSFFIKLFISLIILSAVPLIIIDSISNYAILKSSEAQIGNNSIGKLKVADNTLKQLESTVFNDSVRISVNASINDLSSFNKKTNIISGNNLSIVLHAMNTLNDLVKVNDEYVSVYLYLDDFPYVFTTNNDLVNKSTFIDKGWLKYYQEYKNNRTVLSLLRTRIPYKVINDGAPMTTEDCVITHIYPLTTYTTNLNGALVINIKADEVGKLINSNNLSNEGYIFIIDKDGQVISHPNNKLLTTSIASKDYIKQILGNRNQQGYLTCNVDGTKSLVSYYKSSSSSWTYIGVFSIAELTSSAINIRLITIYVSLFIIILGIIVSLFIAKRIYSPVKLLVRDIKLTKNIDINKDEDELSVINRAFQILVKEDKALFDVLERNKRDVRDNYLKSLLYGNPLEEIDVSIIKDITINNNYICIVFSIDNYNNFTRMYNDKQNYMKSFISQIIDEVLKGGYISTSLNLNRGEIATIINLLDDDVDGIQLKLKASIITIKEELSKILQSSITVGVGMSHQGLSGINGSYFEALTAIKQKLKLGYNNIILWNETYLNNDYYYPINIEAQILNCLRVQSKDCIEDSLNNLIDDLFRRENLSCENITQIFTQLIGNTIVKYLLEQKIFINDIFGAKVNIYYELSTKETINDIKCWLYEIYIKMIDYCIISKSNVCNNLHEIIEYISENYRRDIGINDISEHVGLSYSHVRKIFKDELGENIIEYINKLRVKEAKHLLSNTNLCIKNIANDLGYNNDQSFTRFFKKYEGITPGEYRSKQ